MIFRRTMYIRKIVDRLRLLGQIILYENNIRLSNIPNGRFYSQ